MTAVTMATTTTITTTAPTASTALDATGTDIAPPVIDAPKLSIIVEFTGGLEMLFSDQRHHALSIPAVDRNGKPVTIAYLIEHLCENTMRDTRKELFVLDDHIRPGILVLINDADWELEGEEAYEIQDGDNILFVSTLHGG